MASVSIGTSVASSLDTARKEQIEKNFHYLKTEIWAIMFCATQKIALCGHREGMSSNNKGSFLELIDLLAMYDPVVRDLLAHGPHNAQYTSHTIQNQLVHILGQKVRNHICDLVHSAGVFSIIVDESKDMLNKSR